MKLLFKQYDPATKQFQFVIEAKESEDYNKTKLVNALLTRQKFFSMYLQVPENITDAYTITVNQPNDIRQFLFETKKCFLSAEITPKNWVNFIESIESDLKIDLTLLKNITRNLDEITPILLHSTSNAMLDPRSQALFKNTSHRMKKETEDYKILLKTHFPMDYAEQQKSPTPTINYQKAFTEAYARDYAYLTHRAKKLMSLFKAGGIEEIKNAWVTLEELLKTHDTEDMKLTWWAYKNNRQTVLDYCYKEIVIPFYQDSAHILNVHKLGTEKSTILHYAIMCRQSNETINLLLLNGARINAALHNGYTAFMIAVEFGYLDIVKYLASLPSIALNAAFTDGSTSLFIAAQNGHLDIVKYLTSLPGIILNAATRSGITPLLIAAEKGYFDIVKHLASLPGIDLNAAMTNGATPLFIAVQKAHFDIVKHLASLPGIALNATITDGATPLYIAAQNGQFDIVTHLASLPGIDLNAAMTNGATPLFIAAQKGNLDIVIHLASQPSIALNACTTNGATPLYIAAQNGNLDIVIHLASLPSIALNAAITDGATPLYIAAQEGNLDIVKHLASLPGINLNECKTNGKTPLCIAAQKGNLDIVKYLASYPEIVIYHIENIKIAITQIAKILTEDVMTWANATKNNTTEPLYLIAQFIASPQSCTNIFFKKNSPNDEYILLAYMFIENSKNKSAEDIIQQIDLLLNKLATNKSLKSIATRPFKLVLQETKKLLMVLAENHREEKRDSTQENKSRL